MRRKFNKCGINLIFIRKIQINRPVLIDFSYDVVGDHSAVLDCRLDYISANLSQVCSSYDMMVGKH